MQVITYDDVMSKVINIKQQKVIIDIDVAKLYGVETKRINEAVSRNSEKFPEEYLIKITEAEWNPVKSQFATSPTSLGGGKVKLPTAFTEKGLYMLATILKSPKAIQTTLAIIDTFAKIRELNHTIGMLQSNAVKTVAQQKSLLQRAGEIATEVIIADEDFDVAETETVVEMGFPFFRVRKNVKKVPKNNP